MSFFGLTDPWIWASYVGCFVCLVVCAAYYLYRRDKEADEDD